MFTGALVTITVTGKPGINDNGVTEATSCTVNYRTDLKPLASLLTSFMQNCHVPEDGN